MTLSEWFKTKDGQREKKSVGSGRQTWANVPSSLHSGINMDSWGLRACSKAWFLSTRHLDWPASVRYWHCIQTFASSVVFYQRIVCDAISLSLLWASNRRLIYQANFAPFFRPFWLLFFPDVIQTEFWNRSHCGCMKPKNVKELLLNYLKNP